MKCRWALLKVSRIKSPSMRREWIEMGYYEERAEALIVSLHAEGVD